ncbi:hypothetical protein [Veillonella caviae]|uniref:hypothetical protein n=1 Tax=Veillonella caviae TaxID=248316 RepID=UPI0038B40A8F
MVADAGYDSYENLEWLARHDYVSCIKPRDYEKAKRKARHTDINKARNMEYLVDDDAYICANRRRLNYAYTKKKKSKAGFSYKCWLKQIIIWPTHCIVELKSGLKVDIER